ncbi:hypothetical protein CGRA01v4_07418 [Colletotrichum graminicola]|uniref:Protein disulfide-isomerase n=1 Tax=Colletotrichum graminicola (strain M1.001 / M2 / FGSC 10212) TaxID=645133 RepID=E3QC42_COLGM|nr:uncharacterized protein GLRG_03574 [Colletotrichum graminicola M1.001]EFQ28430.1 hypothetical protein GLRG_03574 [Colletotrichum graminicola M1.001]WDK16137.1 hypothetical protein CGRA01v4_07418 [Colletotrichum graminicola]
MAFKALLPLLALAGAGFGWQHKTEAEVRDALKSNEFSLVAFVSPSTDVSKALEQHWSAVEEAIPTALSVDCLAHPSLCADLDVVSFPAIRLYLQDGTKHRFRGPRKASEIAAFVRRMLRPAVTLLDEQSATSFRDEDDVVMIAHVTESETNLRERFTGMAEQYRDRHTFGLTTIDEAPGRIGCYNNADGSYHMTSELDEVGAMENLLRSCASQLVPRLTRRNEAEHLSTGKSLAYFFSKDEGNLDAWTSAVKPLARKYHEYITFVTVDSGEYPEMPGLFGLRASASEGVVVQNPSAGLAFPFKGDKITVEAVDRHILDISEGNADAWQVGSPALEEEEPEEVPAQAGEEEQQKAARQEEKKTGGEETSGGNAAAHDEL